MKKSNLLVLLAFVVLLVLFTSGCASTPNKVGNLVGVEVTMGLNDIADGVIDKANFGGIVIVELDNGTEVRAIWDKSLGDQVTGGMKLELAPTEDSNFWKVIRIVETTSSGPKPLSDAEFSSMAQGVCKTLQTDSASLDELDLPARASAYGAAVDALAAFTITEKSAPQGTQLRSGLAGLADSFDKLGKAISDATVRAKLKDPITIMITDNGTFYAYSGPDILRSEKLDIEPGILSSLKAYQDQVQNAATALKLEDCVSTW